MFRCFGEEVGQLMLCIFDFNFKLKINSNLTKFRWSLAAMPCVPKVIFRVIFRSKASNRVAHKIKLVMVLTYSRSVENRLENRETDMSQEPDFDEGLMFALVATTSIS